MERPPWYVCAEAVSLRLLQSVSNRPVALAALFFVCLAWMTACGGSSYGPPQSNPLPQSRR